MFFHLFVRKSLEKIAEEKVVEEDAAKLKSALFSRDIEKIGRASCRERVSSPV